MHKLIEYICDELEELERKAEKDGKLTMAEVEYMDTLAHAKKNLLKADEMEGEDDYYSNARGRRGNVRRDAMGRYSRRGDGYSMDGNFRSELEGLMHNAPDEHTKAKLQRLLSEM